MTPEEIKKDIEKTLKELRDYQVNITFDTSGKSLKELQDNLKVFQAGLEKTKRAAEEIGDGFETTLESLINAQESVKNLSSILKSALTPELKAAQKSVLQTLNIQEQLNEGYGSEAEILRNIRKIKYSINNLDALNGQAKDDAVLATVQNLKYTKDVAEKQLEIVQSSEAITKNIDSFSNLLSEIPVIGKTISGPFKDITDEINKASKAEQSLTLSLKGYEDQLKRLKELDRTKYNDEELEVIDKKIKKLNKNITETNVALKTLPKPLSNISEKIGKISLQGLAIGILTKAFMTLKSAIVEIDDQSTQLARSLSISKQEGVELRNTFNNIARDSSLTTKELVEAQLSFTKLTGIAVKLSESNVKALAESKDLIGLSENAQKGLISFAKTTGEEFNDINNTVLGTSKITQLQNGLMMDQKEILDAVLSTSNLLRIQFGNNVQEITRAVVEAKRLGFTLQDIEGVQSNLLNFESSIAAELEAELLTGKELNLEKARYYALQGDIRGLTQEINKNIGSSVEFENMNVIAREAFAKSLGFSADKLAEILITQEQNDAIAKSLNGRQAVTDAFKRAELDMNAENLALLISQGKIDKDVINSLGDKEQSLVGQLSMQQEFNRAVEQLKEIFVSLMQGPVGSFITGMTDLLNDINNAPWVKTIMGPAMLGGLVASISLLAAGMIRGSTPFTPMFVKDIMSGFGGGVGGPLGTRNMAAMNKLGMSTSQKLGANFTGAAGSKLLKGTAVLSGIISGFSEFSEQKDKGKSTSEAAGRGLLKGAGAGLGAWGGASAGAALGAFGGPLAPVTVPLGALIGGIGGAWGGGKLADLDTYTPMATGGMVTAPTYALVGEAGSEAVIPLDAFYRKFDELISETKAISNMRVQLETGVIAGHMTNGGTKTG